MNYSNAKDAKAAGSKIYFTGISCRNGHVAPRYAGNRECVECDRARKMTRKVAKLMAVEPVVVVPVVVPVVAMKTVRIVTFKTGFAPRKGYNKFRPVVLSDRRIEVRV